jgi:hypothetical protein
LTSPNIKSRIVMVPAIPCGVPMSAVVSSVRVSTLISSDEVQVTFCARKWTVKIWRLVPGPFPVASKPLTVRIP